MKKFIKHLREYFESNLTAYTYLFFAQSAFAIGNFVWPTLLKGDFGKILLQTFQGYYNIYAFTLIYFFPVLFLIASVLTSKYPKDKIALSTHLLILSFFTSTIIAGAMNELILKL